MRQIDRSDFTCRCCGACCRIKNGIVRVNDEEIRRIAGYLNIPENVFIAEWTDIAPDRKGLVLKSRGDGSCIYLNTDNFCDIHEVKPQKCATFPFQWVNSDSYEVCPALSQLRSEY